MGPNARERASKAPVPEHQDEPEHVHEQVIEYLNSSDWQSRLEEARAKRELALAARAAASEGPPRPTGPATERERRVPVAKPIPVATPIPTLPAPRPANVPSRPAHARPILTDASDRRPPPVGRARTVPPSALVGGALAGVTMAGLAALWVAAPEPAAPPDRIEAPVLAAEPGAPEPAAPDVADAAAAARPATIEAGPDSLSRVLDDLGAGYDVRIVTTAKAASEPAGSSDAAGSPPLERRASRFSLPDPTVIFFHPEDAAAAGRVSERLGAETLDLTGLLPSPPAGTLEVHLTNG